MRDFLDVHPAFGRNDHGDPAGGAVDQHRQIVFLRDVDTVGHIEPVDLLAGIAGLDSDQRVAEHVLGVGFDFLDALRQTYAALGVGAEFLERALAAATGVDLRFHDVERTGQLLGAFHRFFDSKGGMAGGDADAVFRKQFLGLVFVDVHGNPSSFA